MHLEFPRVRRSQLLPTDPPMSAGAAVGLGIVADYPASPRREGRMCPRVRHATAVLGIRNCGEQYKRKETKSFHGRYLASRGRGIGKATALLGDVGDGCIVRVTQASAAGGG